MSGEALVIVLDSDARMVRWNHGGKRAWDLLAAEEYRRFQIAHEQLTAGSQTDAFETRVESRVIAWSATLLCDGDAGSQEIIFTGFDTAVHGAGTGAGNLTHRELEVFRLIGIGRGTRQIAEELRLSVKTVESYYAHIKEKLSLQNARELVRCAVQWSGPANGAPESTAKGRAFTKTLL